MQLFALVAVLSFSVLNFFLLLPTVPWTLLSQAVTGWPSQYALVILHRSFADCCVVGTLRYVNKILTPCG